MHFYSHEMHLEKKIIYNSIIFFPDDNEYSRFKKFNSAKKTI
jgi:hypothetical protein